MDGARLDKIKTVLRVTSGNFLEMYDFFLFGIYARQIAHAFFPSDEPLRLADGDLPELRGRLRHAADRRARARAVHRPDRPAQGPDPHPVDHGLRHDPDRLRARPTRRSACSRRCWWCSGGCLQGFSAGVELGGVSVYLVRDGDARPQGLLRQLAIGEPAGGGRGRGAPRLRDRQPDGAGGGRRLGLAHPVLHRLRDRAVSLRHPALARGDGRIRRAQGPSDARADLRDARRQLGGRARRRGDGRHDDGVVLPDHGLHADLRPHRPEAQRIGRAARDDGDRRLELRLAADLGRASATGSGGSRSSSPSPCLRS